MLFKNTRPTLIQRPNGDRVLPGEVFTPLPGEMDNPGMKVFMKAGFLLAIPEVHEAEQPEEFMVPRRGRPPKKDT